MSKLTRYSALLVIILTALTLFGTTTIGSAEELIVLEVYDAASATPSVPVKQFTLSELEGLATSEGSLSYDFSGYNTYGTHSLYLGNNGPTIASILKEAFQVSTIDACLANGKNALFTGYDGYKASVSKTQLTQQRYYYPSSIGITEGSAPTSSQLSGAVAVPPIMSWESNGRFFMGQLGPSEQHTLTLCRNMIPVSPEQGVGSITVNYESTGTIAENLVIQNNKSQFAPGEAFHLANATTPATQLNLAGTKVYYTLDGSTPNVATSAMYNYNTNLSPAVNKEIIAPTTVGSYQLKLLLYRYGATDKFITIPITVAVTPTHFTVTYDARGGSAVAAKQVAVGQAMGTLPTPTRTGYTFNGWYTTASGGTKIATTYKPTADVTLYAQWTALTYTVKYCDYTNVVKWTFTQSHDEVVKAGPARTGYTFTGWYTAASGGTKVDKITKSQTLYPRYTVATFTVKYCDYTNVVNPNWVFTQAYNENVKAGPARTGYTFTGWWSAASGGTQVTKITSNITLYPRYKINTYTVKYCDYTNVVKWSFVQNYNEATKAGPGRTGYTFTGWWTAASGGTKVDKITGNLTLYPRYTINTYTVKYCDYTNVVNPNWVFTQTYNENAKAGPGRAGYTFTGWWSAASGGSQVTKITSNITLYPRYKINTYTVKYCDWTNVVKWSFVQNYNEVTKAGPARTGYTFTGWWTAASGGSQVTKITSNITLYPRYKINTYTVKYCDYTNVVNPNWVFTQSYNENVKAGPGRTGYTFIGWWSAASGGTQVTKITSNITLYPRYKINTYTVKYCDYANVVKWSFVQNYNEATKAGPGRTGYTFTGWWSAASGGTQVTKITSNITLYPRYKINTYTVKYCDYTNVVNPNWVFTQSYNENVKAGPGRTGYTFTGWWSAASGGTQVTKITSNITLYPRYKINTYTVKYCDWTNVVKWSFVQNYNEVTKAGPARTGYTFTGWWTAASGGTQVTKITGNVTLYPRYSMIK